MATGGNCNWLSKIASTGGHWCSAAGHRWFAVERQYERWKEYLNSQFSWVFVLWIQHKASVGLNFHYPSILSGFQGIFCGDLSLMVTHLTEAAQLKGATASDYMFVTLSKSRRNHSFKSTMFYHSALNLILSLAMGNIRKRRPSLFASLQTFSMRTLLECWKWASMRKNSIDFKDPKPVTTSGVPQPQFYYFIIRLFIKLDAFLKRRLYSFGKC